MIIFRLKYALTLILAGFTVDSLPQTECTVPLPPRLTNVSVNPQSGYTELRWDPSPSPDIDAYIVYSYSIDAGLPRGDVIDTIWNPDAVSWSYFTNAVSYFSMKYVVASYRKPKCGSRFSNIVKTIYCSSRLDTCRKEIRIEWNSYPARPDSVTGYTILASRSGDPLSEISSVNPSDTSFIFREFGTGETYCFLVKANLASGSSSWSNRQCIFIRMQRPPEWINADQATVTPAGDIDLSFTVDPASEIRTFDIERKEADENNFIRIAGKESESGKLLFTDTDADVNREYLYRLAAVNNCGIPVVYSDIAGNIVLRTASGENPVELKWNSYPGWTGGTDYLKLFINTGSGFTERVVLNPADTSFKIDYRDIMYEISGSEACFYIKAGEGTNQYGISGESISNSVCIPALERITVANVFTPDNDLLNDHFKPSLSFTPSGYRLIITDRNNNTLFETTDHLYPWDGTKSGTPLPRGVYLWYLQATTPSGKLLSRSGTITIIRNR